MTHISFRLLVDLHWLGDPYYLPAVYLFSTPTIRVSFSSGPYSSQVFKLIITYIITLFHLNKANDILMTTDKDLGDKSKYSNKTPCQKADKYYAKISI